MPEPTTIALIALAAGGVGAATSAMSTRAQNKAAKAQQDAAMRANEQQSRQASLQAGNELQKEMRQNRSNMGRIVVAQQNSGVSMRGLQQSVGVATAENTRNINLNAIGNLETMRNRTNAQLSALEGQKSSVWLSGVQGAISGSSAGISLASGLKSLKAPKKVT